MAVAKAEFLNPLKPGQLSVNKATLIIGGGLAGITRHCPLANQGLSPMLWRRKGNWAATTTIFYYTLEGLDTKKHLEGLLKKVEEKKDLIHVMTGSAIKDIEGFIGNYKTTVTTGAKESQFEHGVVIIATGAYENKTTEYLYGKNDSVVTQRELEKLIVEGGGKVTSAKKIVMIQCVGSRCDERPYCSRYCCSEAIKNALKLKEADPDTDVTIIYRDIRTYGLKEDYYKKAREANVKFVRYEEDLKPDVIADGSKLRISTFDYVFE